jgi:hypothetical protein
MIDLQIDVRSFEAAVREIGGNLDQVPFALSQSMNDAVRKTRRKFVEQTWPNSVHVRNERFLNAALRMSFSNKNNLTVSIYDYIGRANLALHAKGGTRTARGKLAIPGTTIRGQRGSRGVPEGLKPRNLPNSFKKGDVIFQRMGRGSNKYLRFAYLLKPSAHLPKDVPFYRDFADSMMAEIARSFPTRFEAAMRSRRSRS